MLPVGLLSIALPVCFLREGRHELGDGIGLHETVLQQIEHSGFEDAALERLCLLAGMEFARRGAGDIVAPHGGKAAPAAAAMKQTGQQMCLAPPLPEAAFLDALDAWTAVDLALTALHGSPERIIDDAQLGHVRDHPLRLRVLPRYPFPGRRILDVAQAVPDHTPDIKLIVQDPCSARSVPADRCIAPHPAPGTGHLVFVQFARNRLGGVPLAELSKNLPDDLCLAVIDGALAGDHLAIIAQPAHHIIPIGLAASRTTGFNAPAQAAPCLVGKVLEEQLVHRALEADMQLVDLTL